MELLIDYPEKEENKAYSRARDAMNVCLGWLKVSFKLEEGSLNQSWRLKTGGVYQLISLNCPPKTGHDDLKHTWLENPGFCFEFPGAEETSLWPCIGVHKFFH